MASTKPVKVETAPLKPLTLWENTFGFPMFRRLSRDLDTMFDRFGIERPTFEHMPTMWTPEMEMFTKENDLVVKVDVPGMKKEEISIEVTGDHLVVRGERKSEKEEKKEGFYRTERTYGSFFRTVPVPEGAKAELAKATLHDGVLEITIPMTKIEEKTKKVEISEPAPATVKAA